MSLAFLCPGQGSQNVGMGYDFYCQSDLAKKYFNAANEILDTDIQSIMFEGPEETLKQTQYTQPALYILSVIIGSLLMENGLKPAAAAGHSLGEYSAYTLAGAFDFESGLTLVKVRAKSMQKAGEEKPGTMAAIIGLDDQTITELIENVSGTVVAANYNSPGQVVISGEIEAVEDAMAKAKETGARMVKQLNVSGAFHSPLMNNARDTLAEMIDSIEIIDSMIPVYVNVSAKPVTKADDIRFAMIMQLESPVLWSKTIMNMASDHISHFMEVGPGRVLQGLCKRINRSLETSGIEKWEQLEHV
ncbi:MAG: ACP S-malonyltransferase [Candidatus Marinimicrobia bacterium]|nr:ACP S-malonyltransferase [Candidatus Neomarinimicrobiota bacterium]MCH7762509.1 ACP S-malonyltransferase [Candidatus Neomarinimicrobiota bacterium]